MVLPKLINKTTNEPIKIFEGSAITLTFTVRNNAGVAQDISTNNEADYKLTSSPEVEPGGNLNYTDFTGTGGWQVSGSFTTDGTDGQVDFNLTATELTTILEDAVMEFSHNPSGTKKPFAQWRYDVLDSTQQ
jgi:hypothetical protein